MSFVSSLIITNKEKSKKINLSNFECLSHWPACDEMNYKTNIFHFFFVSKKKAPSWNVCPVINDRWSVSIAHPSCRVPSTHHSLFSETHLKLFNNHVVFFIECRVRDSHPVLPKTLGEQHHSPSFKSLKNHDVSTIVIKCSRMTFDKPGV